MEDDFFVAIQNRLQELEFLFVLHIVFSGSGRGGGGSEKYAKQFYFELQSETKESSHKNIYAHRILEYNRHVLCLLNRMKKKLL
jgi:hypothetical protein